MKKLLFIIILLISILSCGTIFAFFAFNITPGSISMIGGILDWDGELEY